MKTKIAFLLSGVLIAAGIVYRINTPTHTSGTASGQAGEAVITSGVEEPLPTESEEEKRRRLLTGVWQDDYQGKRRMTLNEDGTGTMVVELTGVKATLFASRLQFEMQWSLNGDMLVKKTVGGEPARKVDLILKMMGDTAEDRILEITDERLMLLDKDGQTEYDWRRVPREKPGEDPRPE